MNTKKIAAIGLTILISSISNAYAVTVRTFGKTTDTDDFKRPQIDGSRSILDIISFANNYLWFAIGFVCFLFLVINGYKLIMNNGDEKQSSAATSGLLKSIIGIAICLLAYIIVNIAVKLFA